MFTSYDLTFGAATGWYLVVEETDTPNGTWNEVQRIGIGARALLNKGLKFALSSNTDRLVRFSLLGDITGGHFTVKAVGIRP